MARRKSKPKDDDTADLAFALGIAGRHRLEKAGDAWARENVDREGRKSGETIRTYDGDVLGLLLKKGSITHLEHAAGEWLYRHWYEGGLAASGIVDLTKPLVDTSTYEPVAVHQLEHRQQYALALDAIGPRHAHAITAIVIGNMAIMDYAARFGRYSGRNSASAATVTLLAQALDELSDYRDDPAEYRRLLAQRGTARARKGSTGYQTS